MNNPIQQINVKLLNEIVYGKFIFLFQSCEIVGKYQNFKEIVSHNVTLVNKWEHSVTFIN